MNKLKPIRLVVVDDSLLIRKVLAEIFSGAPDIEVVGMAEDAYAAREIIRNTNPDVVTLDIEMPGMSGLEFLEKLMRLKPTPVVMISTLTVNGAEATFQALDLGAVDFHPKPVINVQSQLAEYSEDLREKVRAAARSRLNVPRPPALERVKPATTLATGHYKQDMLLIGASTGGTEAIKDVLQGLQAPTPPILIVQHMPPGFTRTFAQRLDKCCPMRVFEACSGMPIMPGHAYLAPGGSHLLLNESGARRTCILSGTSAVNRHRPSVDVLFHSVASSTIAHRSSAVLLTGMGEDGADGLLALKAAGAHTIAQDEASCVVFGMPREAIARGAAEEVLALDKIAEGLMRYRRG